MTTAQPVGERPAWVDDKLFPFESRFVELDGNVVHGCHKPAVKGSTFRCHRQRSWRKAVGARGNRIDPKLIAVICGT
jgi:hypothetical protein